MPDVSDDEFIVGNKAAAEYLGIAESTWRAYVARGQGVKPEPRRKIVRGHALPKWRRDRLDEWKRTRHGKAGRPPTTTA